MLIDLQSGGTKSNHTGASIALDNDASDVELEAAARHSPGAVVTIAFPKFNDGRGFSIARLLRDRYRFHGEIRAVGNVIPDQATHLLRAGFDTVELPDGSATAVWQSALTRYSGVYQTAFRNPQRMRHTFTVTPHPHADATALPTQRA